MLKIQIFIFFIILFQSCSISTEVPKKCYDHDNPECVFTTCKTNVGCLESEYCDIERNECLDNSDFCEGIDCGGDGVCSIIGRGTALPVQMLCICDDGFIASGLRCVDENLCNGVDCEIEPENDLCDDVDCGEGVCVIPPVGKGRRAFPERESDFPPVGKGRRAFPERESDFPERESDFPERESDFPERESDRHGDLSVQMQCICDFGAVLDDKLGVCVPSGVDLCDDVSCDENENCVLGNCVEDSSFCSEGNECVDSHHCWNTVFNDELELSGEFKAYEMSICNQIGHVFVIPKGQKWKIELKGLPLASRVFIYDSHFLSDDNFAPLALSDMSNQGNIDIEFLAFQSGEHVILIERNNVFITDNYEIKANCVENCKLESTRYPVILIHGYAGTDNYFGLADYFWKVKDTLLEKGYAVYTPRTRPLDESEDRAIELAASIDEILKDTGARKLNLIAHSQGGLDARVLITGMGYYKKIVSLTTIGTPHRGIGIPLEGLLSVQNFSPEYAAEVFNPQYTNMSNVKYWSYSSRTCGALSFSCQRDSGGERVNILLATTHVLLRNKYGDNDGVVPTYSMIWGEHLGMLFADHFDEIGQIFDNSDDEDDAFRHLLFYENEMLRLKREGF